MTIAEVAIVVLLVRFITFIISKIKGIFTKRRGKQNI